MIANSPDRSFPASAGILFGLGLGGFFDGIVLHQILQWHHMLTSAGYPADSVANLRINTLWDGIFHASTYLFVVLGLIQLWRTSRRVHVWWSGRLLLGITPAWLVTKSPFCCSFWFPGWRYSWPDEVIH